MRQVCDKLSRIKVRRTCFGRAINTKLHAERIHFAREINFYPATKLLAEISYGDSTRYRFAARFSLVSVIFAGTNSFPLSISLVLRIDDDDRPYELSLPSRHLGDTPGKRGSFVWEEGR